MGKDGVYKKNDHMIKGLNDFSEILSVVIWNYERVQTSRKMLWGLRQQKTEFLGIKNVSGPKSRNFTFGIQIWYDRIKYGTW